MIRADMKQYHEKPPNEVAENAHHTEIFGEESPHLAPTPSTMTPQSDALFKRHEAEGKDYSYRWHDWSDLAVLLETELSALKAQRGEAVATDAALQAGRG